ncbi:hypothetical protein ABGV40_18225 [Paenibacillus amylolyticus]|uniref:hypothetical protein n=1 Tax=Paenibacillus amylolyticus TaxID=1451 RepID=UPI003242CC68
MPIDGSLWKDDPILSSYPPSRVYKVIERDHAGRAMEFLRKPEKRPLRSTVILRGDSMLRKYLFLAVLQLARHQPDFKRWHKQNVKKGDGQDAIYVKLIGKLARILIGMVQHGETYRSLTRARSNNKITKTAHIEVSSLKQKSL